METAGDEHLYLASEEGKKKAAASSQLALTLPTNHMGHLEDGFFLITHILCYEMFSPSRSGSSRESLIISR